MGLFTRTVLLVALIYLSIQVGVGLSQLGSNEVSNVDRLVAARNVRRAITARAAYLDGGMVGNPVNADLVSGQAGTTPDSAVDVYVFDTKVAEGAKSMRYVYAKKIEEQNAAIAAAKASGSKSNSDLTNEIAVIDGKMVDEILKFNTATADMSLFAHQVRPYAEALKVQALKTVEVQSSLYILKGELDNLEAEKRNQHNMRVRSMANSAGVEDQLEALRREHVRISELISRYDRANPTMAATVDLVGTPWVEGVVTWAGADSRVGRFYISIGEVDGVREGQVLSIQRNGHFVGRGRVESLENNSALLRLEEQFLGGVTPMRGDTVSGAPNLGK